MKKLIGLMICLLVMVLPYRSASVAPATNQVRPVEYYEFQFRCWDNDTRYETRLMDERISPYATFSTYTAGSELFRAVLINYIDCDKLCLYLFPLDLRFNGPGADRMHLWRMGAEVMDPVDEPINWGVLSDLGSPDDEVRYTIGREFCWDEKWPEDFWVVKYEREGEPRRNMTKVRYIDGNGYIHWFYAIPFAGGD
ncbi:MAG: hypothetical protein HY314_17625 [Acidobacteria bacterium]|nr:hypothetical protein [Acidobacteriota bacterium]